MATLNTYDKRTWNALSYAQTDPRMNLVQDMAFPPRQAPAEAGKFRETAEQSFYKELDADRVSKYTVPQHYGKTDAFRYYKNDPISAGFSLSNADLSSPGEYGYNSVGEWIEDYRAWLTKLLKKHKEKALYTAVSDNTNFEGATYYANAATAWSSTGTANTKDDIEAGRLIVEEVNAVCLSWKGLRYALQNQTFRASAYVAGPARDDLEVTPGLRALKDYWEVDYIFFSRAKLQTDSSDATDTTRTEIWGDKVLLYYHNPNPTPLDPGWMRQLFWAPMGKGQASGGWFWTEDEDKRPGGVGVKLWDLWNYYQFLVQEKSLGYRIDNIY